MREQYWQLDFFRASAIISVFLYHNLILPQDNFLLTLLNYFIKFLWCGVDLFFVLSGFLITTILINTRKSKNRYSVFIIKRILRIFPLYYFWLLFYPLFLICIFNDVESNTLKDAYPYLVSYTFNFFILQTSLWPVPGHLNHLWSLAIEEQFYFIWPLIVFVLEPKKLIYVLIFGILIAHSIKILMYVNDYQWNVIYTQPLTRMDALLCGGLAAWIWKYKKDSQSVLLAVGICAVISFIFILRIILWQQTTLLNNHTVTFITIGLSWFFFSIILLSLYINHQKIRYIFDNIFFKTIATLSYGIYISHLIIMNLVTEMMVNLSISNIVIEFFLNLVFTLAVSYMLYRMVEKPCLNYKNTFKYKDS